MTEQQALTLCNSESIHTRNRVYRAIRSAFVHSGRYDEFLKWYFRGEKLTIEGKKLILKQKI